LSLSFDLGHITILKKSFAVERLKMAVSGGPRSAAARLREMLADKSKMVVAPGVYDGISARIALEMGFDVLYMVTLSLLSLPPFHWPPNPPSGFSVRPDSYPAVSHPYPKQREHIR
jgi:hypothetical protein